MEAKQDERRRIIRWDQPDDVAFQWSRIEAEREDIRAKFVTFRDGAMKQFQNDLAANDMPSALSALGSVVQGVARAQSDLFTYDDGRAEFMRHLLTEYARMHKELAGKRPSSRHRPGEYEFPKRYFDTLAKRQWMDRNARPMTLVKWLRQQTELDCWSKPPQEIKTGLPDDPNPKAIWVTEGEVVQTYEQIGKALGYGAKTARQYIRQAEAWGYLKTLGPAGIEGKAGGRAGTRFHLGRRTAFAAWVRPDFTWLEPQGVIPTAIGPDIQRVESTV